MTWCAEECKAETTKCLQAKLSRAILNWHSSGAKKPQWLQTDARYLTSSCYWYEPSWGQKGSPPHAESSQSRCRFLTGSTVSKHLSGLGTATWLTTETLWTSTRETVAAAVWFDSCCMWTDKSIAGLIIYLLPDFFFPAFSHINVTRHWIFSLWRNYMLCFYELEHKVSPLRKWIIVTTLFKAIRGQWKIKGGVSPHKWMYFIYDTGTGLLLCIF